MADSVKNLSDVRSEPHPAVVSQLEKLLAMARSGDLRGFVIFSSHLGGCTGEGTAGDLLRGDVLTAMEDWRYKSARRRNE